MPLAAFLLALTLAQPPIEGEDVRPAQFVAPVAAVPPQYGGRVPPMPPTPQVQLMMLVPQDADPGQPVPYQIKVQNSAAGKAHKVRVRLPWPDGAESVTAAEPKPATGKANEELVWEFGTLEAGEARTISIAFRPKPGAGDLVARGYVSFEHGQKVTTRLSGPRLKVKTDVPKQSANDDPIPVQVVVTNSGKVPAEAVKLTVNISDGFEFDRDATGEPTKESPKLQRAWDVGTLRAGEARAITFRLASKAAKELLVTSSVSAKGFTPEADTAKCDVLEGRVKIELKGDPIAAGNAAAVFEAVVTNAGTLPLTNVRVTGGVPDDCTPVKATRNAQVGRDRVEWVVPRLKAGEAVSVRWGLTSAAAGRRQVRASVAAGRGLEDAQTVETVFRGAAAVNWETKFDQPAIRVDGSGLLTVRVNNTGSEAAKNVRLTIELPPEVSLVQATPNQKPAGQKIAFDSVEVRAGGSETFTLTFRGEQAGPAYFAMRLTADALGDKPLVTTKMVTVQRK